MWNRQQQRKGTALRGVRNNGLTLEVAINTVRAAETSKTQVETLTNPPLEAAAVHVSRKNQKPKQPPRNQPQRSTDQKQTKKPCGRCGSHHKPRECKAFGYTCHKCQGKNHFAHMCRAKNTNPGSQKLHKVEQHADSDTDEELFLGELVLSQNNKNELFTNLNVNDEDICFKVDTRAQCNVIPEHAFNKLTNKPSLQTTKVKLTAYGGIRVPIKGTCPMEIKQNGKTIDAKFFIVAVEKAQPLIGLQTCRDLELISINNTVSEVKTDKMEILDEYQDVFTGLGLVDREFHIELRDDAKPTIHPPRKVPLSLMPKLKETLEKMTEMDVISKVEKATDWVNSLVIDEKKDGSLRLCLDPKDLNKSIKREHYKPPTAETISSKLNGKQIFIVIDMSNCYWHKKLDEESSYLCTFNTPFGRYKFNRMPFGIGVASDVAQRLVDDNFSDIPGVLAVHDDIIIAGKDTAEHDSALKRVLERARGRNIKFNRGKVQLRVNQVKYLGDIVTGDGFKPDPEKIKAIINMPYKEFKQFANDWGFKLTSSSPTYPQANGLSEKAVQTVKRILKKTSDPYIGLLEYRNTPVTGMTYSPTQLLMSRATRTKNPVSQELLEPKLTTKVKQQLEACQQNQAHYYNQGAKPLTALKPQEVVRLRQGTTWIPALVNEKAETPRSYLVTTATGQQYRWNRKDLLQTGESPPVVSVPEDHDLSHTTETQTKPQTVQSPVTSTADKSPISPPRSTATRTRTLPTRFKDYVMNF